MGGWVPRAAKSPFRAGPNPAPGASDGDKDGLCSELGNGEIPDIWPLEAPDPCPARMGLKGLLPWAGRLDTPEVLKPWPLVRPGADGASSVNPDRTLSRPPGRRRVPPELVVVPSQPRTPLKSQVLYRGTQAWWLAPCLVPPRQAPTPSTPQPKALPWDPSGINDPFYCK